MESLLFRKGLSLCSTELRWRRGSSGSVLLCFCSLAISVGSPCPSGPGCIIVTSALQLTRRGREGTNGGCSHSLKSMSQKLPSHAQSQTLDHTSVRGRLGDIISILGLQAPCHTILLLEKGRADPEMLL